MNFTLPDTSQWQIWIDEAMQKIAATADTVPALQTAPKPPPSVPLTPHIPINRKTGKHPTHGTLLDHHLEGG